MHQPNISYPITCDVNLPCSVPAVQQYKRSDAYLLLQSVAFYRSRDQRASLHKSRRNSPIRQGDDSHLRSTLRTCPVLRAHRDQGLLHGLIARAPSSNSSDLRLIMEIAVGWIQYSECLARTSLTIGKTGGTSAFKYSRNQILGGLVI